MVARNKGLSSVALISSPGRWHETSTLTKSLIGTGPRPGTGSVGGIPGDGGSSYSRGSVPLNLESIDCDEATRILGGGMR